MSAYLQTGTGGLRRRAAGLRARAGGAAPRAAKAHAGALREAPARAESRNCVRSMQWARLVLEMKTFGVMVE